VFVGHVDYAAGKTRETCLTTTVNELKLILLELRVNNCTLLKALLDSGASNNFIRQQTLENGSFKWKEKNISPTMLRVRLATGASVHLKKRVVILDYTINGKKLQDEFLVINLDDKYDVILGMPW